MKGKKKYITSLKSDTGFSVMSTRGKLGVLVKYGPWTLDWTGLGPGNVPRACLVLAELHCACA